MSSIRDRFTAEEETGINLSDIKMPVSSKSKMFHYTDLVPNEKNRDLNNNKILSIAESIKTHGRMIDSPQVTLLQDGKALLWVGHHRHAAVKHLVEEEGLKEFEYIKCDILPDDPLNNELTMIDTNLERAELKAYDMMVAIGRKEEILLEKRKIDKTLTGTTRDLISQNTIGLEATQVGKYLRVYKRASPKVKKALKEDKINLETAAKICLLSDQDDQLKPILHPKKRSLVFTDDEERYKKQLKKCYDICTKTLSIIQAYKIHPDEGLLKSLEGVQKALTTEEQDVSY